MAWFIRFTRFTDVHAVYAQEAQNSCGIASVLMTVFKINKLSPGHQALHKEKEIYRVYGRVSSSTYDGSSYTYANHLASTLNKLDCGAWKAEYIGPTGVAQAIVDSVGTDVVGLGPVVNSLRRGTPIIVLVGWDAKGAHFVVVDTVNKFLGDLYASVCDPWDGNVHVTRFKVGRTFAYVGAPVPLSWDLGGARHDYAGTSPGACNGWVVHQVK